MTNGDKIRSMTDGELAAFLVSDDAKPCEHCKHKGLYGCDDTIICTNGTVRDIFEEWLSSDFSERSENSCFGCGYYDRDLGCGLNAPCPYD